MYLEWAPENSLTESAPVQKAEEIKDTKTDELKTEETNDKQAEEDDEEEPEENTTIFVKNLNFETTDDSLRKVDFFNHHRSLFPKIRGLLMMEANFYNCILICSILRTAVRYTMPKWH